VVNTAERLRRPFTPQALAVVVRERICKGGPAGGGGCGHRAWSEEYEVAAVPSINESEK
jgi:hypothetical protein